jgi:hypothetical protein
MGFSPSHHRKTDRDTPESTVNYLDGEALLRPLSLPKTYRFVLCGFVAVALIIGGIFLYNYFTDPSLASNQAKSVEDSLARGAELNLPVILDMVSLDDATILASFEEAGYTTYNMLDSVEGSTGVDVIKLPEGVSLIDAGIAYSKGVSSLTAAEAVELLNGSWRLTANHQEYVDMKIKYADFSSGTIDNAIQTALESQGLQNFTILDSGVDSAGNTYQSGTVDSGGSVFQWQISACPLKDYYNVSGLPDGSFYVVIRIHQ